MEFAALKDKTEENMKGSIESLHKEFKKVRTGRAQVTMLDSVKVDYYGNPTPLNQVAAVSCPDARSFLISPWEANALKAIESAIVKSDLGMAPINDGKTIRLKMPELTEDRRKDIVKTAKKSIEDAKISVRKARKDANDELKIALKDKLISEDDNKGYQDKIQKMTDKYIEEVEKVGADKEKEIMTI